MGRSRRRRRRAVRALAWVVLVLAAATLVNILPTLRLQTGGMQTAEGERVSVHHEDEEAAALEVLELADGRAGQLQETLGVTEPLHIDIYVYDDQATMQRKRYGFVTALLGLDWYIGDNIGTTVLLTSPANPGPAHDADSVRNAVLHEIVHAVNSVLNPDLSYWLDNGIAGYLSGQEPPGWFVVPDVPVPTLEDTRMGGPLAPLRFSDVNGYPMSYTYVEHLDQTFGWDAVRELARTGDHQEALGVGEEQVYADWVAWLGEAYGPR